jgi:PmbA protein
MPTRSTSTIPADDPSPPRWRTPRCAPRPRRSPSRASRRCNPPAPGSRGGAFTLRQATAFPAATGAAATVLSCVAITGEGLGMERDYFGDSRTHAADLMDAGGGRPHRRRAHGGTRRRAQAADRRLPRRLSRTHLLRSDRAPPVRHQRQRHRPRRVLGARPSGAQVLPKGLSLTEDPLRPASAARAPSMPKGCDRAAGYRGRRRPDGMDARPRHRAEAGAASTANAARGTGGPPSPSVSNVTLTQGEQTLDALWRRWGPAS